MATTAGDLTDINPLERMEKLGEMQEKKRSSIAQKKKEFEELEKRKKAEIEELDAKKKRDLDDIESKKKELEDLEKKKSKEIKETEDLIEMSFQDLMRHKRLIIEEEEKEKSKAKSQKAPNLPLEDTVANAPKLDIEGINYSKFFEQLKPPAQLYQAANPGFYNNLSELRNKAAAGTITPQEETFVEQLKERFENFQKDNSYIKENDQNQYINRSMKIIGQIEQYHRLSGSK